MFAGFSVHNAVAAYYTLHVKNEAHVSPRRTDVLLTASNLFVHAILICAFCSLQDCTSGRLLWGSEKLFAGVG